MSKIIIFDLATTGHHSTYIKYLVEDWLKRTDDHELHLVVSSTFNEKFCEIVKLATSDDRRRVEVHGITSSEQLKYETLKRKKRYLSRVLFEYVLVRRYVKTVDASHCVLMYFDHFQIPLALGLIAGCTLFGIYFRPSFHYDSSKMQNFDSKGLDRKTRLKRYVQKYLLSRALKNRSLQKLFTLDPYSVAPIQAMQPKPDIVYLCDPVKPVNLDKHSVAEFKAALGIESARKTFLQFGSLNRRKGIQQLLHAIKLLSDEAARKVCLLLVGSELNPEDTQVDLELELLTSSPIQIIRCAEFVTDDEVPYYFAATDFVLAPYQKHVGMSGLLMQAAVANKPILASDYGLVGQLVREHRLGLTYDSASPAAIARCLTIAINSQEENIDVDKARAFVQQNVSSAFSQKIFDTVCA